MKGITLFAVFFACLTAGITSFAQGPCPVTVYSGTATYYLASSTFACSFDTTETGSYYCAMNAAQYDTAGYCGTCLSVTGSNGTHTVVVNDLCPSCGAGNLDLSPVAFQAIVGDLAIGISPISWQLISCPYASPIWITNNAGSNPYYASVLVHHATNKIAGVEAYYDSAWHIMSRSMDNYWTASLTDDTMIRVRVTDLYGSQIIVDSIKTNAHINFDDAANFPACVPTGLSNMPAPAEQAYLYYSNQRLWLNDEAGFQAVALTDLAGKIIYQQELGVLTAQYGIDAGYLPAGMYLIRLRRPDGISTSLKWVKAQ